MLMTGGYGAFPWVQAASFHFRALFAFDYRNPALIAALPLENETSYYNVKSYDIQSRYDLIWSVVMIFSKSPNGYAWGEVIHSYPRCSHKIDRIIAMAIGH